MGLDKNKLKEAVLSVLQCNLNVLVDSAIEAKEAATNEESKAENKYDTRGLEASYLAGAQAKRASELKEQIYTIEKVDAEKVCTSVEVGAVVYVFVDEDHKRYFYILPAAAGEKIQHDGHEFFIVTPSSPIGKQLMGRQAGEDFELKLQEKSHDYEILSVQ